MQTPGANSGGPLATWLDLQGAQNRLQYTRILIMLGRPKERPTPRASATTFDAEVWAQHLIWRPPDTKV